MGAQKRRGRMQWGWQRRRSNNRRSSSRLEKGQTIEPANLMLNPEVSIELEQIRAAPQKHVLAVVYHFTSAGMLVGRGPAAKIWTPFKNSNAKAAICQSTAGGQSGETSTNDRDS